jgi:energy-coupling factor transporter ATP-binding protein EcfA2
LSLLGLESVANHSPFELSGGQQQRLALATVFALDPDIIILDEPTTFLDPQGAELVFETLSQMQQQGKTIVIAEQRLDLIAHYADRVLAFDNGNLVMDGRPQEVLTSSTMQKIRLDWTRYTQVADLARKRGLLQESKPLPASLGETVKIFSN